MDTNYSKEQQYLRAKKRVKDIKGFYSHLAVYIIVNIFISSIIIYGLTRDEGDAYSEAFSNFGVYATWVFWGIGVFFHWLGVFGVQFFGFGKNWEERKIKQLMKEDEERERSMKHR